MSDTSTALWGGGGGGHSVYVRHEYGSVSSYVGGGGTVSMSDTSTAL